MKHFRCFIEKKSLLRISRVQCLSPITDSLFDYSFNIACEKLVILHSPTNNRFHCRDCLEWCPILQGNNWGTISKFLLPIFSKDWTGPDADNLPTFSRVWIYIDWRFGDENLWYGILKTRLLRQTLYLIRKRIL